MATALSTPPGMHTLIPSLVCRGAAKAIDFYKAAFGATELMRMATADGKAIMHAELRIGDSVMYLSDEMPGAPFRAPTPEHPATAAVQLYCDDADATFARATSAGAKATMPPADMFWGDRMGMVIDPFGHGWMISTHLRDVSEDELKRGAEAFAREMQQQQRQPPQPRA